MNVPEEMQRGIADAEARYSMAASGDEAAIEVAICRRMVKVHVYSSDEVLISREFLRNLSGAEDVSKRGRQTNA